MRRINYNSINYARRREKDYVLACIQSQETECAKIRHPAVQEVISAIIRYERKNFIPPLFWSRDETVYATCADILMLGAENPISEKSVIALLDSAKEKSQKIKLEVREIAIAFEVMSAPDFLTENLPDIRVRELSFKKLEYGLAILKAEAPVKKVLDILVAAEKVMLRNEEVSSRKKLLRAALINPKSNEEILSFLRFIRDNLKGYFTDPISEDRLCALRIELVNFLSSSIQEYEGKVSQNNSRLSSPRSSVVENSSRVHARDLLNYEGAVLARSHAQPKPSFTRKKTLSELNDEWDQNGVDLDERLAALEALQREERYFFDSVSGQPDYGQYAGYVFWHYVYINESEVRGSYNIFNLNRK